MEYVCFVVVVFFIFDPSLTHMLLGRSQLFWVAVSTALFMICRKHLTASLVTNASSSVNTLFSNITNHKQLLR